MAAYTWLPNEVSRKRLSTSSPNEDRFSNFFHPYHHILTALLHYLVKYTRKSVKSINILVKIWRRVWCLIFWPILYDNIVSIFTNTGGVSKTKHNIYWNKKITKKLLYKIFLHTYLCDYSDFWKHLRLAFGIPCIYKNATVTKPSCYTALVVC